MTDDIFNDFSPTRILEAFINPTGRLKASIDAASQADRTFGIRAAHASKNIQEWVRELEEWDWPSEGASMGFEVPPGKRRKLSNGGQSTQNGNGEHSQEPEYIGSLLAPKVLEYESRIDHIHTELEELHVEEIKRHVLVTHFTPSRPSSSSSNASSSYLSSYTKMEDFTAIVTATVLKALPNLSKLMQLMDVWSVRLSVLHKVPRLLRRLEEGEIALRSGWTAIQMPENPDQQKSDEEALTREAFEIMRNVLQDKVTTSGRDLDFMLDTLEGREDTLPESWLDRMEAIEHDYGEWVVAGDRKVRQGEWAKMAKIRKEREEEARRKAVEAARIQAELDAKVAEAELQRLLAEKRVRDAEAARLMAEQDAQNAFAEAERLRLEKETQEEAARFQAEKDVAEVARRKSEEAERVRVAAEEAQKLEEEARRLAEERRKQENEARLQAEQFVADANSAELRAKEAEVLRLHEEESTREETARQEETEIAAAAELARMKFEDEESNRFRLEKETHEAMIEATRIEKQPQFQEALANQAKEEVEARELGDEISRFAEERRIHEAEADRVREEREAELAKAAKHEEDRQLQEAEASQIRLQHEAKLVASAKLAEERRIQEASQLREEHESREAMTNTKILEERKIQEAEAFRVNQEQELAHLSLARKLEQERIQALEATRLRDDEQAQQAAIESERIKEDQKARDEATRLRQESETAALVKIEEQRKLLKAQHARLDAEKVARDLAAAKLKVEQDEAQAELSRQQIQKAKEAEDELARRIAQQQVNDIEAARKEAETQARVLRLEEEEANAKRLADEARELELSSIKRQKEQDAKAAEVARLKAHDEAETARLQSERDAVESARLHALQEQSARDAKLTEQKYKEEAARLKRDADALESDRLQAESDAIEVARSKAIQDARNVELKEFERLQKLKNAEAENNRIKAFKVAENERAEIARVRTLLLANEKAQQPQQAVEERDQPSDLSTERKSPKVPADSLNGVAVSQKFGPVDSECDVCDSYLTPPKNKYATFDGSNDLESEFLAYYEGNDIAFDQESSSELNSAEEWASNGIDSTSHSAWGGNSKTPKSTDSSKFKLTELSKPFPSDVNRDSPSFKPTLTSESSHPTPTNKVKLGQNFSEIDYTPDDPSEDSPFQTELDAVPNPNRSTFGNDIILPTQDGSASDSLPTSHHDSPLPTGYSASDPTPDILDAEPASYFRPLISPVKSTPSSVSYSGPNTPTSSFGFADLMPTSISPNLEKPVLPQRSPRRPSFPPNLPSSTSVNSPRYDLLPMVSFDGSSGSVPARNMEMELHDFKPHSLARKTSITRINSPSQISISRRDSTSSNNSTVINSPLRDVPASPIRRIPAPIRPSTPTSPQNAGFSQEDDLSPSIRRHRNGKSHDYTSPDSPPPIPNLSKRISTSHKRNDSFSSLSKSSDSPTTPTFSVDHSPALPASPKKANSDAHMQQQISNILESIPARIRLTTESDVSTADTSLNVTKSRRPVASSLRSSSSMSNYSRAPTPSFTLAPARGAPRQRAQNGNPEIKVYHLSRSTGEAPIKLFVRLVGENGERVMVRVGGGWADLGEYLKEYASHHGRRAAVGDNDKIEIQDLPPRIVSAGSSSLTPTMRSTSMTSTNRSSTMTPTLRSSSSIASLRSNGRASPAPPSRSGSAMGFNRPASALGRPISSLAVRKTRQSTGANLDLPSPSNTFRSPSTPMPSTLSRSALSYDNTPSPERGERERSSSRLSWTEEESSLGLAGPKAKKVVISEKDQEWVESMKEKVRLASAEKDKEKIRRESGGRKSFGEMDRVGGVKRLWRKGGL